MSVEPPPSDRIYSDSVFHYRRSILDGEPVRQTRPIPRVTLEASPDAPRGTAPPSRAGNDQRHAGWHRKPPRPKSEEFIEIAREYWEAATFQSWRRGHLVGLLCLVIIVVLAVHGWQRGTLWGSASAISTDGFGLDSYPAAPRLSSDDVAWSDVSAAADGDGRRSTASFGSDQSLAGKGGDEPSSGAKILAADGKKSSKGSASSVAEDGGTSGSGHGDGAPPGRFGSPDGDDADISTPSDRKSVPVAEAGAIRYENCAEAVAAGAAPIRIGQPGYRLSLDRDKDGVACENGSQSEDPGDAPADSLYSSTPTTQPVGESTTTVAPSIGAGTTSTTASMTSTSTSTAISTATTRRPSTISSTSTTAASTTGSTRASSSSSVSTTSTTAATTSTTVSSSSSTDSVTTPSTATSISTSTSISAPSTTGSTSVSSSTTTSEPPTTDPNIGNEPAGSASEGPV